MTTRTIQGHQLFRVADIKSVDPDKRTVDLVWTTGHKGKRSSWFGDDWFEELEVSDKAIRMDRLNAGAPLLDTHGQYQLSDVLAVVERSWIENGVGMATVRFSKRADVEPIFQDVKDGIIRNVSVGYRVHKWEDVTEGDDKVKTYRAIDWEPMEISLVPIGFDPGAQTRSAEGRPQDAFTMQIISNRSASEPNQRGNKPMTEEQQRAADEAAKRAAEAAAAEAKRMADEAARVAKETERKRAVEIRAAVRAAKLEDSVADDLCARDVSVDEARKEVLDMLAKRDAAKPTGGARVTAGDQDEILVRREAAQNALLHRFNPRQHELHESARRFRGMSLVRMAEELLGLSGKGMTRNEIAQRALSSSDFPIILGATVGKTLRAGYTVQARTFQAFVRFGTLADYKEVSRVQLGDAPNLAQVVESGEYAEGSIGEAAEKIKLLKYGKIIRITEEAIVNDDLDAFTRIPGMMGAAAARLESKLVYDVLLNNAAMADNVVLFHATHGNLGSAAAITETSLNLARAAIRKQKNMDGTDTLDLEPAFLICGPDKETEAKKILSSQMFATKSGDVNVFANSMAPVVESRIPGNKWFVAAAPSQVDTIEVAYLEGMSGPELTQKESFESDGIALKVKHVVGVKPIDYRGLYYNPGA